MSCVPGSRAALGACVAASVLTFARTVSAQTSVAPASSIGRVSAGSVRLVRATPAGSAIVIDGRLDDAAWRAGDAATDFVQQRPVPGAAATERTEARVTFDAAALYVAMRLFDARPDSLIAPLGRRDSEAYGDWAHVMIDSYRDRKTAFAFAVNPAGTRRDALISNDSEWQSDESWDAVWDVAVARDSLGWSAEFRIPLTQLRFERCASGARDAVTLTRPLTTGALAASGDCVWGIQFARDLGRRNERSLWAPIALDVGGFVSRFGTLAGVDGLRAPRRLELVPYSVGQVTRAPLERGNPFYERTALGGALGADLGLGITSKLSLTATINPDFGQVEADPSEVNLTGFETFLREQRPFFVEGNEIFQYPLSDTHFFGSEQLFYSRRIGRAPQVDDPDGADDVDRPDATTILGAAKLSGRIGGWTLGMLDAVTGAERARYTTADGLRGSFVAEPTTNYAVARLSRDDADGRKTFGAVATAVHRDLDALAAKTLRASALTAGIDGRVRTRSRDYMFGANLLGSHVRGSEEAIAETQRSSVHLMQRPDRGEELDSTRTSLTGVSAEIRASKQGGGHWRWGANGRVTTSGFEANDVGFQLRSDVMSLSGWVGYTHTQPGRTVRRWDVWSNHWARWTFAGERERASANVFANVQFQSNWMVMGEVRRELSQMSPTFLRGGPSTFVPSNAWWWGQIVSDPRRMVSGNIATQGYVDDEGGGRRLSVYPTVTIRPSSRAEISLQPNVARVRNPAQYIETASAAGDTSYVTGALSQTTTSLTARLNLTFTPALSLQLYAQPFVSAGEYRSLGEVRDARARSVGRRVTNFTSIVDRQDGGLRIDRGAGRAPLELDDPDFTVRELKSNAVLRWEYRPGSALFVVWAQSRDEDLSRADFSVTRQAGELWRTKGTNVLLIKASYWISR